MSVFADPAREDKPFSYDNIQTWFARVQITFFRLFVGFKANYSHGVSHVTVEITSKHSCYLMIAGHIHTPRVTMKRSNSLL